MLFSRKNVASVNNHKFWPWILPRVGRGTPGTPLILFPGPGYIEISEGELTIFHLTPMSSDLKPNIWKFDHFPNSAKSYPWATLGWRSGYPRYLGLFQSIFVWLQLSRVSLPWGVTLWTGLHCIVELSAKLSIQVIWISTVSCFCCFPAAAPHEQSPQNGDC